jgi:hypothetical protein
LINQKKIVSEMNPYDVASNIDKFLEVPLEFELPAGLPSSFFYGGDFMSVASVFYSVKVQVMGLSASITELFTEVIQAQEMVTVRAID